MIREAEKAGTWYPADPRRLAIMVDRLLDEAAHVPTAAKATTRVGSAASGSESVRRAGTGVHALPPLGEPLAGIVPHAGLEWSGLVAARVYAWFRAAVRALDMTVDTVAIFGASHRMHSDSPSVWARGLWRTPLGDLAVDGELAERLIRETAPMFVDNPAPHLGDNAIELQMPFVARLFPGARVLPVAISADPDAYLAGEALHQAAERLSRRLLVLGSTDLTHYGAPFGLAPAGNGRDAVKWAKANDRPFLEALAELRLAAIVPAALSASTICGGGAAAAAAGYAKAAGALRGRLLEHASSHDATPDAPADHFVDYASIAYARE